MKVDPKLSLEKLIQAFQEHYEIACNIEDDEADELTEAEERLQDAFFSYDNAIFSAYGVELPFDIYDDEDDEDIDEAAEDDIDDEFEVYELDDDDDDEDEE